MAIDQPAANPEILLLPSPTRVMYLGGKVASFGGLEPTFEQLDMGAIPAQGYTLTADSSGLRVQFADAAGRRHALATLAQLRAHAKGQPDESLPCLRITDAPRFAIRGVMLDVSRDRVPTMAEFASIIAQLAAIKINHLQLYTEHTFAYAGHESVWQGWSPLTGDEIRTLDALCAAHGIELAANQNCFGHLAQWLRNPKYAHLAETHGDWMFEVWPRSGPFSLCPTDPASLELVRDLLGQLVPNFSSTLVNIGCDETYDITFGRSKDEVARRGRAAVYLEFVAKVCEVARALGRTPMFWADIALHDPGCIPQIPKDLISLAWGYEPHSPFAKWTADLAAAGRRCWVCPGTSSWRSITGRSSERNLNLNAAAACSGQADGFLSCDWGDTGHHQMWPIALHAIAHSAQAAWAGETGSAHARACGMAHGVAAGGVAGAGALGEWLESLGDVDAPLRQIAGRLSRPAQSGEFALWNQSALFADLHNCAWDERAEVVAQEQWQETRARIEVCAHALPAILAACPENAVLARELGHTLATAALAADRAIARRARPGSSDDRAVLAQRIGALAAESAALWPLRSRPGGLEHSQSFWQKAQAGTRQPEAAGSST